MELDKLSQSFMHHTKSKGKMAESIGLCDMGYNARKV